MSDSDITPSNIIIYGINSFINKFNNSKNEIFDLDELKINFDIDFKFNKKVQQIEETDLPAFTSLSYNKRIVSGDTSYSESYNNPPIGPLPNYTFCTFCKNISPNFHAINCPYPENKSLFLTLEGFYYYIILSPTYKGKYEDFKPDWLNESDNKTNITQDKLNEILLIKNSVIVDPLDLSDQFLKEPSKYTLTNIRYLDVIKSRGPTKLEYSTATQKFNNALMISYEYVSQNDELKKTSIRIYKNGLINLINIPSNSYSRTKLYSFLKEKLNVEGFNLDEFNVTLVDQGLKEVDQFTIIDELSYIHSINGQFNLWPIKDKFSINFQNLTNLINPFNQEGKLVDGKYSTIQSLYEDSDKRVIFLYNPLDKSQYIQIINWEYISGKETKLQTKTRDEIKCLIIPYKGIKINLQIHKHGTFQMSMSYCNSSDIKNNICSEIYYSSLNESYFDLVKTIFSQIFKEETKNLISLSIDYIPDDIKNARNTISGNAPPKQPGSSTEVCRNRDPRPGYPGLRPIPYSFQGKCPEAKQYIDPIGVLGNDGLYYPCCSTKTQKAEEEYKKILYHGFPKNKKQAEQYGIIDTIDTKSGILVPGSYNIGSITKGYINDEWKDIKILNYKGKKPLNFLVQDLKTGKDYNISRDNLLRDSRYFSGLKTFNREKLLKCIFNVINKISEDETIINIENLNLIKSKINLPLSSFNPILTIYDLEEFSELVYRVSSVPQNTEFYYLYIDTNNSYFINLKGNKINKSLNEKINETIIFAGFLNIETLHYYISDLLYLNKKLDDKFSLTNKLEIISNLEEQYFTTDTLINLLTFDENVIKSSRDLIIENPDSNLVFIPETYSINNFRVWYDHNLLKENINTEEVVLQIIKKNKTNYYTLGFDNTIISSKYNLSLQFNNINITKKFMDENNIKINDYVLFKFDYNIQTGDFSIKFLIPLRKVNKPNITFNQLIIKLAIIINPIKSSFFLNNQIDDTYTWLVLESDSVYTFINKDLPLKLN